MNAISLNTILLNAISFYIYCWLEVIKNRIKIIQNHWHLQHWIHYNKKIDDYENTNSVNLLYLIIGQADGHIEENNENKYLAFTSADGNRKV